MQACLVRHMFSRMSEKRSVTKTSAQDATPARSSAREVEAFLRQAKAVVQQGDAARMILALDATMSRQPTWDLACQLQGQMFDAVGRSGALNVQLVYFRGFGECRASRFVSDTDALKQLMTRIDCRAGHTQVGKILTHALKQTGEAKVSAIVYIGDAFEEAIDDLAQKAGKLGILGVPVFVFQEGRDVNAERAFKEIARLTRGAWFRFDRDAAATLARLLASVAVFATGGLKALEARGRAEDRMMIEHLTGRR